MSARIKWEGWADAKRVGAKTRAERARAVVGALTPEAQASRLPSACITSGDSLVYAVDRGEGVVEVYDCQIRRVGTVRR